LAFAPSVVVLWPYADRRPQRDRPHHRAQAPDHPGLRVAANPAPPLCRCGMGECTPIERGGRV